MKQKIIFGLGAAGTALAMLPLFAAFEAHVVNVTARIENALEVPVDEIEFGTVFPQEKLDRFFDVSLSRSFRDEDRVDDVDYFIRQKPKCQLKEGVSADLPPFGQVTENGQGGFVCRDPEHYELMPLLCPYLSKEEVSPDGTAPQGENDGSPLSAFHGPISLADWTLAVAKQYEVDGHLAKSQQDYDDRWKIDLKVPCFGGHCAQDWEDFVRQFSSNAIAADYIQPLENESKLFGCDLWLEVKGISLPRFGCEDELDAMLVLDHSGSISDDDTDPPADELDLLKVAAKAFVDALAPSTDGVHIGLVSFSTGSSLTEHLTDDGSAVKGDIDALTSFGTTNLEQAIEDATAELANPGDGHDRADGDSPDVMVIITDGAPNTCSPACVSTDADDVAAAAANAARAAGIQVYVVGVGVTAETETYLETKIADDADHYFGVADFADLEQLLKDLVACPDETG